MTKPIIVVKVPCKLLYVIQVKEFLIKCSTSWPYLISEFLVAYITIVASDWPRTFFTPKVFLFSIIYYSEDWIIYWERAVGVSLSSQRMRVSNTCNTEFRLLIILGDESIRLVRLCLQVKIFVL